MPRAAPSSPLTAPVLKPGGAKALRDQGIDRASYGVKAITIGVDGKARFNLENGQIWKQVDTTKLRNLGDGPWTAEIRKAAMGSYLLTLGNKSVAVRVERVN